MSESKNPYVQTESNKSAKSPEQNQTSNKANKNGHNIMPKVIGIISLLLGAYTLIMGSIAVLSLIQMFKTSNLGFSLYFFLGISIISVLMGLWGFFIGIKLIKYHDIGRRHFNYFVILSIILTLIIIIYARHIPGLNAFIKPILLIVMAFILNQKGVKDTLNS